jgi:hypothetical protein
VGGENRRGRRWSRKLASSLRQIGSVEPAPAGNYQTGDGEPVANVGDGSRGSTAWAPGRCRTLSCQTSDAIERGFNQRETMLSGPAAKAALPTSA